MRVVNLKSKEPFTVYIGRDGYGYDASFGNPIRLNTKCMICSEIHNDRGSTLPCYEIHLRDRLKNSAAFRQMFMNLVDQDVLGCFCKPDACHGDIMIKVWTELNSSQPKI